MRRLVLTELPTMTETTKTIIRDALQHRERNYRGFADCDRIDAIHCGRSDNPIIRSRAENLEQRANEGDQKAAEVRRALEEFDSENH